MAARDDARRTLVALGAETTPTRGSRPSQASLRAEPEAPSWTDVFAPRWRTPLKIGLGLAVLQQITGINAIIYYSDSIFAAAGFTTPAAQTAATTWAIGAVNVLSTFIAIAFIDRLGRRPLLIAGLIGMALSLAAVGFAFPAIGAAGAGHGSTLGVVTLVALVVFIISFAFSLGPVTWTVINEIYPGEVRGRAVAVATAVNWGAAFLVSGFFLVGGQGDRPGLHLLAVRRVLRDRARLGHRRRARDAGPLAGRDRGVVARRRRLRS